MTRKVCLPIVAMLLSFIVFSPATQAIRAEADKPTVVATTTVLASIVRDLAGDKVIIEVVSSPEVCPAHYDIKPSDVDKVRRASLILAHGFEPWLKDLVKASGSNASVVFVKGSWNTLPSLKDEYITVAEALKKYLGINVSEELRKCLEAIDETSKWLVKYSEENGFIRVPVVVMEWQKPFVEFLGFNVVATYGPPEKVSLKQYQEVVENATKRRALLVMDNVQSGTELGKKIAEEAGAVEVALTNFPGIAPGLNNVTEMMKYNAQLIAQALHFAKLKNISTSVQSLQVKLKEIEDEAILWRYLFMTSVIINIVLVICIVLLATKARRR